MTRHRTYPILMIAALSALLIHVPEAVSQSTSARRMSVQVKGGDERTGHYDVVENWMKSAANHDAEWTWGRVSGVAIDNPNRIIVVTRGDLPADFDKYSPDTSWRDAVRPGNFIVVLDRNGNVVEDWSQWNSKFREPHQVFISPYDSERKIWVVDNTLGKILVFSNDGRELVMEVGNPQDDPSKRDRYTFGSQSDMAFLPDGSFLVSDGYQGSRVVKFNARGEYMME